jgi:hypothetical protein
MNAELKYNELFKVAGMQPDIKIVEYSNSFFPRKIPSQYIPKIRHFSRANDTLFYCVCLDQTLNYQGKEFSKKYFYLPSASLFATLMRLDEEGIREALGGNDNLPVGEKNIISKTINHLKVANKIDYFKEQEKNGKLSPRLIDNLKKLKYLQTKGVGQLINPLNEVNSYFSGHAFNSKVCSKTKEGVSYNITGKQFITFENNDIIIPPFLEIKCSCGLSSSSSLKYEHDETVLFGCVHAEMSRQSLLYPELFKGRTEYYDKPNGNRIAKLENILSVFSPLDIPSKGSELLRKIIRKGFYSYIKTQNYIKNNLTDDKKRHKADGYTFFRCELDAFLLSFKESYNPKFLELWNNSIDIEESNAKTSQFFGDYMPAGFSIDPRITSKKNAVKGDAEHLLNNEWVKAYHYIKKNGSFIELNDNSITHDSNLRHMFNGNPLSQEVFHGIKNYQAVQNFSEPFKVGKLNDNLRVYISPYKMRKSRD